MYDTRWKKLHEFGLQFSFNRKQLGAFQPSFERLKVLLAARTSLDLQGKGLTKDCLELDGIKWPEALKRFPLPPDWFRHDPSNAPFEKKFFLEGARGCMLNGRKNVAWSYAKILHNQEKSNQHLVILRYYWVVKSYLQLSIEIFKYKRSSICYAISPWRNFLHRRFA